jgi:hypothetical protein
MAENIKKKPIGERISSMLRTKMTGENPVPDIQEIGSSRTKLEELAKDPDLTTSNCPDPSSSDTRRLAYVPPHFPVDSPNVEFSLDDSGSGASTPKPSSNR